MAYYSRPQFGEGSLRFPPIRKIDSPVMRSKPKKKEEEYDSDGESDSLGRRKRAKPKKKREDSDSDAEPEPKKLKEADSSTEEADSDDEIDILPTFVGRLLRDEDTRNRMKRKHPTGDFETNIKLFLKELADEIKDLKQIVNSWESDEKLVRLLAKMNKYKEDGFSSILAYQAAVNRLRPMIEDLIKDELSKDDLSTDNPKENDDDDDDVEEEEEEQKNTDEEESI